MSLSDDISPSARGKVRDLYDLEDRLLFVASDRISAFDYVLPDTIPYKGEVLTQLSLFWFEQLGDLVHNHLISTDTAELPTAFKPYASELAGRFMLVRKATMFPVECIVRGYLTGSGLAHYRQNGTVCGIQLPQGLTEASRLDEPLYTPSTKAAIGDHDENINFEQTIEMLGEKNATALRDLSVALYTKAAALAADRGIIIADTKFEFGHIGDQVILADEVLTPDSSRFWPAEGYRPGRTQPSFDKQFVRDWLADYWQVNGKSSTLPHLPDDVIEKTSEKYRAAFKMLTGKRFVPAADLL
ncbi:MAG: phosphoribosylaminoimidazolesuccinocarboxamide synthase [Coriobacteriales bacterium]|jgi:phosphoribosylaminoimidazole-succinocarboxamide synthase|nr:phosphoribosylaminoimidazolesuccinocarboxamide synthase [Coriobacteriales bacterium]